MIDTCTPKGGINVVIKYDAFEHLCRSLFKSGEDIFGMITGYFDESGTSPSNPAIGVAGYFGSCDQWGKFNVEWRKMLSDFNLSEFHRTDIENMHLYVPGWTTEDRKMVARRAHRLLKSLLTLALATRLLKKTSKTCFRLFSRNFMVVRMGIVLFFVFLGQRIGMKSSNRKTL